MLGSSCLLWNCVLLMLLLLLLRLLLLCFTAHHRYHRVLFLLLFHRPRAPAAILGRRLGIASRCSRPALGSNCWGW